MTTAEIILGGLAGLLGFAAFLGLLVCWAGSRIEQDFGE